MVLDSFELNMNDRLYYKVVDPEGRVISGYDDLPNMPLHVAHHALSRAGPVLSYRVSRPAIRVAKLLQPINEDNVSGMAEIYVAETLQSRRYLATQLLFSSLVSQAAGAADAGLNRGCCAVLRPMRQLSSLMVRREPGLLAPLPELLPRSETRLLIVAFNRYIDRLRGVLSRRALQRRCVSSAQNAAGGAQNPCFRCPDAKRSGPVAGEFTRHERDAG